MLLHELFEEQAKKRPKSLALREGPRTVTFGELQILAERVASGLDGVGVGKGALVGLHLERSVDWVAGVLAILKMNATVIPLPPSYPEERTREVVEHAGLDLVVDHRTWPFPSGLSPRVQGFGELTRVGGTRSGLKPKEPGDPDQPAFILCSSGSTGRPKMIVRSHRSFFHRLNWTWKEHPFQGPEVGCQKAHMTTTHALYELFEPLLAGYPAVIVPDEEVRDLRLFWQRIREAGVTRLLLVPSALRASLDLHGFEPPPLKVLVLMGEYLHDALARRASAAFPPKTHIFSIYGSTEASSVLVCAIREALHPGEDLPLGTPISPQIRFKVLDTLSQPVEDGEEGRLYVAGPALFTEYLDDPAQTQAVLTQFPGEDGWFFDTRDQVRLTPSGDLKFVGRADDMVKIRGFRVDLRDVERALLHHPKVTQAAVIPARGPEGSTFLAAYYVPRSATRAEVYETLSRRLPGYMVPSLLVGLDEFPLTSSGKVNRTELEAEYHRTQSPVWSPGEGVSDTERRIGEVWVDTLGHARFGVNDSFFEVGGDSISVFSLAYGVCDAFGLTVDQFPEQSVYASPTIRSLASRVHRLLSGNPAIGSDLGENPLLVVMRSGTESSLDPLFFVSSAGGTVGAYRKLSGVLSSPRELLGIRDPFLWGDRDPTEGFQPWVDSYLRAIRDRQPNGPYFICAYSTAGAFGLEIARRLQREGAMVPLLILVDPLALDRQNRWRYGYWALRATYMRPLFREVVRWWGRFRGPVMRLTDAVRGPHGRASQVFSEQELASLRRLATRKDRILMLGALLELNTGLPLGMAEGELDGIQDEDVLEALKAKFGDLVPAADPQLVQRIAIQYEIQVRTQHAYRLSRYDGPVLLVEPASPHAGLLAAQLGPFLPKMEAIVLNLGLASERTQELSTYFQQLEAHYRCMRDDAFVEALGMELDRRIS